MEFIGGVQSCLYYFSEEAGGWNMTLVLLFLAAPLVARFVAGTLFAWCLPVSGTVADRFLLKRGAASMLGLREPRPAGEGGGTRGGLVHGVLLASGGRLSSLMLPRKRWESLSPGDRVHKPAFRWPASLEVTGRGERPVPRSRRFFLRYAAAVSARNFLAALALIAMALGAAGLWARPAWIIRVVPNRWHAMPFEAAAGTVYLLRIDGAGVPGTTIAAGISGVDGGISERPVHFHGDGEASWAVEVVRMTEGGRPRMMVRSGHGGSYRVVLVRRPVRVLGYLVLEALCFLAAFLFNEVKNRVPAVWGGTGAVASLAGRWAMASCFTVSFLAGGCALWYLGVKALDRVFHFGIWITYDHFIQDIMRSLLH
ncbi:MAG: hypothetical protein JXA20_01395 [Spirochaetes bacterium]|nr:hypothetical protein [Spirochaetota bacterium]